MLLSRSDASEIAQSLNIDTSNLTLYLLQEFDTEHQFCSHLKNVLRRDSHAGGNQLFILQCDSSDVNLDLIACARYNICNEFNQVSDYQVKSKQSNDNANNSDIGSCLINVEEEGCNGSVNNGPSASVIHVVFIIQLQRVAGGCFVGFQVQYLNLISV